jgi:hypothetical protein
MIPIGPAPFDAARTFPKTQANDPTGFVHAPGLSDARDVCDYSCCMPRQFRLFPRYRRPSVGELIGTTQAKRQISRRWGLATLRDPTTPIKNLQRRAKRRVGYYSEPVKFARHTGCALPIAVIGLLTFARLATGRSSNSRSTQA